MINQGECSSHLDKPKVMLFKVERSAGNAFGSASGEVNGENEIGLV